VHALLDCNNCNVASTPRSTCAAASTVIRLMKHGQHTAEAHAGQLALSQSACTATLLAHQRGVRALCCGQCNHEGLNTCQAGPQVHQQLQPCAARLAGQLVQVVLLA
jgi:hypothetical protein